MGLAQRSQARWGMALCCTTWKGLTEPTSIKAGWARPSQTRRTGITLTLDRSPARVSAQLCSGHTHRSIYDGSAGEAAEMQRQGKFICMPASCPLSWVSTFGAQFWLILVQQVET